MRWLPLALLAAAGCTTADGVRRSPVVLEIAASRPALETGQCITERYQGKVNPVESRRTESGLTLTLGVAINGFYSTVASVDVQEHGTERRVIVHATHNYAKLVRGIVEKCV